MIPALYRGISHIASPMLPMLLQRRMRAGKEDPTRLGERMGRPGLPRPPGRLLWIHAASVGESLSVLPLIERLLLDDRAAHVLLTTGTVTSARMMATRLPERALHQYVPVDAPAAVAGFLDHWHPDAAIWVESEFWPNLIRETDRRRIPMALVNARMSERSFRRWKLLPGTIGELLSAFRICVAQSPGDAGRLGSLGAHNVACHGNLKDSAPPLRFEPRELYALTQAIGRRPVWLAASTHPGEERLVAKAHRRVRERLPGLLTILIPRHPQRGAELAEEFDGSGLVLARRSLDAPITAETDIYLADTLGEMGLFYSAVPLTFVGGSLVPHGGQNPLEPARLDCAILLGPHTFNFAEQAAGLTAAGGARLVSDVDALAEAVADLLQNPQAMAAMARAAAGVASSGRQALDAVVASLKPLLNGPATRAA